MNSKGESKIIHHDRLVPINQYQHKKKTNFPIAQNITDTPQNKETEPTPNLIYSSDDSSDDECVPRESGSETEREETIERRYPQRHRKPPELEGYIPWDLIDNRI